MKTSKDYTIADYRGYGEITVPAGTTLTHQTASGIDPKYHFVLDLSWITNNYPHLHRMQLLQDATYYGIDVPVEYVDYEKSVEINKTPPVDELSSALINYYADELKKIANPRADYAPLIKITQGNAKTNWLTLSDESATELVKWLQANYNVDLPQQAMNPIDLLAKIEVVLIEQLDSSDYMDNPDIIQIMQQTQDCLNDNGRQSALNH